LIRENFLNLNEDKTEYILFGESATIMQICLKNRINVCIQYLRKESVSGLRQERMTYSLQQVLIKHVN